MTTPAHNQQGSGPVINPLTLLLLPLEVLHAKWKREDQERQERFRKSFVKEEARKP